MTKLATIESYHTEWSNLKKQDESKGSQKDNESAFTVITKLPIASR